jgi:hypothetical protein
MTQRLQSILPAPGLVGEQAHLAQKGSSPKGQVGPAEDGVDHSYRALQYAEWLADYSNFLSWYETYWSLRRVFSVLLSEGISF